MKHGIGRPTFPTADDLRNLSLDDARAALAALVFLVESDLASVYTAAGSHDSRWQVWSELQQRRIPLGEWATHWIAARDGLLIDDPWEASDATTDHD